VFSLSFLHRTMYSFSCESVFLVEIFSSALLMRFTKLSWVNFFSSPVTMIVD